MTLARDIRAKVYCNLGKLIEGQYADSYAQNAGLIKTRGSCTLSGIYNISPGQRIIFAYYRDGLLHQLPKYLLVLSSSSDPNTRITSVAFGCPLTIAAELRMMPGSVRNSNPIYSQLDNAVSGISESTGEASSYANVLTTWRGIPTPQTPYLPYPDPRVPSSGGFIGIDQWQRRLTSIYSEPVPIPGMRRQPPPPATTTAKIPEAPPPTPDPDPEYNLEPLPALDLVDVTVGTYSQSSLYSWIGAAASTHKPITAATNANMTDQRVYGTATITQSSASPEWVKVDLGKAYIIDSVAIGNIGYWPLLDGTTSYTVPVLSESELNLVLCSLQYSNDGTSWTTALSNVGPYPWGAATKRRHYVSFSARYIRVMADTSFIPISQFKPASASYYVAARWNTDAAIALFQDGRLAKPMNDPAPIVRTKTRKAVGQWYTELIGKMGTRNAPAPGTPAAEKVWWGLATSNDYVPGAAGSGGIGIAPNSIQYDVTVEIAKSAGWYQDGDTLNLAVNFDEKKLWVGVNGRWTNGGDPSTGKNPNIQGWAGRPKWYLVCALIYGLNSERSSVSLPVPTGGRGDGPFTDYVMGGLHYRPIGLQYKAPYGYRVWND